MIGKTWSSKRGEELVSEDELPSISKIVRQIRFGVLRIGEIVTILVSARNEIELVHCAAINRQHGTLKRMADIAREYVRRVAQLYGLASRYPSRGGPVCPRECSKVVVERPILLHKKNDVFDSS